MLLKDVLFSQGFGTRYDCAAMVASGAVEIAAEVHDDPDEDVETEGLVFRCLGTDWPYFEKAIIALNKPAGYECSMKPSAHPSVMTLLPSPLRRRNMQPVGRLDVDTTGVLIFTDDGALQHRLIHPKRHVSKIYDVVCRHPVDEKTREKLMAGVVLDDDPNVEPARSGACQERRLAHRLSSGHRKRGGCRPRRVDLSGREVLGSCAAHHRLRLFSRGLTNAAQGRAFFPGLRHAL